MSPLLELGLVVLGLYLAGWASRKVGLSPVVGYLLLGILLGPHGALPLYRIAPTTELLGELGLLLLLFYLGLEFSLSRILEGTRATLLAGAADLLNFVAGFALALLVGFGWLAGLFLGGAVYVSSSGVIARLLSESDLLAYPEAERTLGVLVFEDLAMVVVLVGLGLLTAGGGAWSFAGAVLFLALYALAARYGRPLVERLLAREGEDLTLLALALVALVAVGAVTLGFPDAVAAFLLGMVVAESGHGARVEAALRSWYEVAAAAFFLVVGLHVDLVSALRELPLALLLVVATVVANLLSAYVGGRASGLGHRASVGHGLMLLPRGEFSLVVVSLAAQAPALPEPVRQALLGGTSLYVVIMVALGSFIYGRYDSINERLARLLRPRSRRGRRRSGGGVAESGRAE
ncbi:MAG: cation:proton antiporter [Deinococcales bacterium]